MRISPTVRAQWLSRCSRRSSGLSLRRGFLSIVTGMALLMMCGNADYFKRYFKVAVLDVAPGFGSVVVPVGKGVFLCEYSHPLHGSGQRRVMVPWRRPIVIGASGLLNSLCICPW